jgi:hypothetical protein
MRYKVVLIHDNKTLTEIFINDCTIPEKALYEAYSGFNWCKAYVTELDEPTEWNKTAQTYIFTKENHNAINN